MVQNYIKFVVICFFISVMNIDASDLSNRYMNINNAMHNIYHLTLLTPENKPIKAIINGKDQLFIIETENMQHQ